MICRISGKVKNKKTNALTVDVGGICYEVFVPETVAAAVQEDNGTVELVTYHYHQSDPSKSIPILIGFLNEVEKEFFEQFIKVSGIGPKAAVKAFSKPISQIARAIDLGNITFLKELPGIGSQRAREIVAKLQGKVAKYGLIKDTAYVASAAGSTSDVKEEALAVLTQLQYKRAEAEQMIEQAISRNPGIATAEEILNEVYRQKIGK